MAGGIYEQLDWPDSRSDYVQVCDGCHTGDLVDPLERGDIGRFRRFPRQERAGTTTSTSSIPGS